MFYAAQAPVLGAALAATLLAYALVLLWEARTWLVLLPLVACTTPLAFNAGQRSLDEFDLFVVATLAVALWRAPMAVPAVRDLRAAWPLLLFALSQGLATLLALVAVTTPATTAPLDYLAPANALREMKPVAWSVLLLPLLAQAFARDAALTRRWLAGGIALALTSVLATLVWERGLYTGLLDFEHAYRVTGPFFDLHVGGAALDVALVVLAPLLAGLVLGQPRATSLVVAGILLAGAFYGLLVTYSRVNYVALASIGVVALVSVSSRNSRAAWRGYTARVIPVLGAVLLGALLLSALGGVIGQRFKHSVTDGALRAQHWQTALSLQQSSTEYLFGIGKGAFPRRYTDDRLAGGEPLPAITLGSNAEGNFLRFSASDARGSLDLRQRIELPRGNAPLRLQLVARTTVQRLERFIVELCARHLRRVERECRWVGFNLQSGRGEWGRYETHIHPPTSRPRFAWRDSPTDISLLNRGIHDGVEIAGLRLLDASGRDLLVNGDFAAADARWFFVDGNHLRWHVQNLYVYLLVESGIVGLTAFLVLAVLALRAAWRIHNRGDPAGAALGAAIVGVLIIGLIDSVLDQPRTAWLFLLMLSLAFAWPAPSNSHDDGGNDQICV